MITTINDFVFHPVIILAGWFLYRKSAKFGDSAADLPVNI